MEPYTLNKISSDNRIKQTKLVLQVSDHLVNKVLYDCFDSYFSILSGLKLGLCMISRYCKSIIGHISNIILVTTF